MVTRCPPSFTEDTFAWSYFLLKYHCRGSRSRTSQLPVDEVKVKDGSMHACMRRLVLFNDCVNCSYSFTWAEKRVVIQRNVRCPSRKDAMSVNFMVRSSCGGVRRDARPGPVKLHALRIRATPTFRTRYFIWVIWVIKTAFLS